MADFDEGPNRPPTACSNADVRVPPVGRITRHSAYSSRTDWDGRVGRPSVTRVWYPARAGSAESAWAADVFHCGRARSRSLGAGGSSSGRQPSRNSDRHAQHRNARKSRLQGVSHHAFLAECTWRVPMLHRETVELLVRSGAAQRPLQPTRAWCGSGDGASAPSSRKVCQGPTTATHGIALAAERAAFGAPDTSMRIRTTLSISTVFSLLEGETVGVPRAAATCGSALRTLAPRGLAVQGGFIVPEARTPARDAARARVRQRRVCRGPSVHRRRR